MAYNNGKPKFNEFLTPIGLLVHCYHQTPQVKENERTKQPVLDKNGNPEAEYKVTLAWPRSFMDTELIPFRKLAYQTQCEAWPESMAPGAWFTLETFLRDGDNPQHNTKGKEYLRGKVYLNFKTKAEASRHPQTGQVTYSGAPGLVDEYKNDMLPCDVFAGCEARVSGIMFGTEYSGKNFISVRLNNIQRAKTGERIGGGGKPDAKSQFDPLVQGGPLGLAGGLPGAGGGFGAPAGGFAPQQPPAGGFGAPQGQQFAPAGGFAPQQPLFVGQQPLYDAFGRPLQRQF